MTTRRGFLAGMAFPPFIRSVGAVAQTTRYLRIDGGNVQGALNLLGGEGVLELGAGDYVLPDTLRLDGQAELRGAGLNATRLIYEGDGAAIQVNSGAGVGTWNWLIRDLTIDGNWHGAEGVRVGQGDVSPKSGNKGGMRDVLVRGFTQAGVYLAYSQINRFSGVDVSHNVGHGVVIDSPGGCGNTDTAFSGCYIRQNGGAGVYGVNGAHVTFRDCIMETNGQEGVWLHHQIQGSCVRGWNFDRCYFEGNGRDQFRLSSDVTAIWQSVYLDRCHFSGVADGYHHVMAGKGTLFIEHPEFLPATLLGADSGSSAARVHVTSRHNPRWQLGGPNSPGIWHERLDGDDCRDYVNDGAGAWRER